MQPARWTSGLLALVFLAGLGVFLVWLPPRILQAYEILETLHPWWAIAYVAAVVVTGAAFLLLSIYLLTRLWWNSRRKRRQQAQQRLRPSQLTAAEKEREIADLLQESQSLREAGELSPEVHQLLQESASELESKLQSKSLEIVAFGTVSSGKSSLLNTLAGREVFRTDLRGGTTIARNEVPWPGDALVTLVDTPGLAEVLDTEHRVLAQRAAQDADLVLFVVDGPLKQFEFGLLAPLADMEKRIIVCLNKEDWYTEENRDLLLGQIREQVQKYVAAESVVSVRSRATVRRRVRVLADGAEQEEEVEIPPEIGLLATRMMDVIAQDGRDMLLANLLLRARGLMADAKEQVRATLDRRARQVVDTAMWQAGGAAALSPLPLLDLAAALGFSTKMVLDLARVYRQDVDLATAQKLLGELGKNLLSILGVSAATPVVGSAVASMLKTVPGAGTIAGGVLQGLVQALITRWIGLVFMEYFRAEMQEPDEGWAGLARRKWKQVTTAAELTQLVKTGVARLRAQKT